MVLTRFAFIIAIDDKTLFRRIESHQTQETSSLTREVRDDNGERTTKKTTRAGGRGQGGSRISLMRGAPLRNTVTDR